ncbi:hypothetical protein ST47_g5760 [Ascochyta rabiei]|uniref:Rhodopsin domain-containing protein n=1 Tax=Didymella rabiei TaxID=5454 RepID=A0A163DF63_DIDRA|nr:hypothetical protein ST47_g5760 [Ascochyta rabiei]
MIVGNVVVQTVGSLFFFARAYSRVAITKSWRAEDHVLALAWQLFCTGFSVCQYGQISNGAGSHAAATAIKNPQAHITARKYAYAAQIILFPALSLSKFSICLTYLRIFYFDKRGRYMIQALMVLLVLLIVPFGFQVTFQCRPVHVYWTEGRPAAKCIQDLPGFILSGSLNIFVEVALMAIVLPRVLELKLHPRQKWALTSIVLLGSLVVAAGIVRMVRVGTAIEMPNFEPSWDSYDVSIWTSTEIYVSLLCASAPGIKPFVVKILPKLLGSSSRSRTRTTGGVSYGIELGLSSKWKRTTIGSTRMNRRPSETALSTADGPYTQVGGGVDAYSLGRQSKERPTTATSEGESSHGHIHKTSKISLQNHVT